MSDRRLPGADLRAVLRPAISTQSSAQVSADALLPALVRPGQRVADLADTAELPLPYADGSVDVVFGKQALGHLALPHELLAEVARVLAPGGAFAGSASHLEPFHAHSTVNVTPYGLKVLLESSGLELEAIFPGIDAWTLFVRRLLRGPRRLDRYWTRRSPFNTLVDGVARVTGWDAEDRAAIKLLFSGQYAFVASKPRGHTARAAARNGRARARD
jgi:SAM-dependent methyltransferase